MDLKYQCGNKNARKPHEMSLSIGARLLIWLSGIFPKCSVPPRSDDISELVDPSDRGTSRFYRTAQLATGKQRISMYENYVNFADTRILDFGCGMGGNTIAYQEVARHVIGVDLRILLLQDALKAVHSGEFGRRKVDFVQANGNTLPFSDGAFDVVISDATMEHVRDPDRILKELWRVLKPDGYLMFDFPSWLSAWCSHKQEMIPIPWVHLICPAHVINETFACFLSQHSGGASYDDEKQAVQSSNNPHYQNHLTVRPLLRILRSLPDCQISKFRRVSDSRIGQVLVYFPLLGELYANKVLVVLKKCKGARINKRMICQCVLSEFCQDAARLTKKLYDVICSLCGKR